MHLRGTRCPAHPFDDRAWIVVRPNGHDLPVDDVKAIHYRDHAEDRVEVEDGSAPLAVHNVPDDADVKDCWKHSREELPQWTGAIDWRPERSLKSDIGMKRRATYIF